MPNTTGQTEVVRDWMVEQFPDLEVNAPRVTNSLDAVMFLAGHDGRGSIYWLAISDDFFTSHRTANEIREQLTSRRVADDLRAHEYEWRLLPRVGPPQPWLPGA